MTRRDYLAVVVRGKSGGRMQSERQALPAQWQISNQSATDAVVFNHNITL